MITLLSRGAIAVCLALPSAALAADTYHIDPLHSSVLIKANHIGFNNVYMRVHDIKGKFTFDSEKPEDSSVTVTLQTRSIDGFNEQFTAHLHSDDFFDVEQFPIITFASDKVTVTGENMAQVSGDLTIRGLSQPALLNVTFNKEGENPIAQDYRAGFSGTAVVKRSEYGIKYALPAVAEEVDIVFEIQGIRVED